MKHTCTTKFSKIRRECSYVYAFALNRTQSCNVNAISQLVNESILEFLHCIWGVLREGDLYSSPQPASRPHKTTATD